MVLVIEGEGPELVHLRTLARRLGVGDQVRFVGTERNVFDLLNASDVVVLPSIWSEDFPNVTLEAMALGKPVIASRLAGIPSRSSTEKRACSSSPATLTPWPPPWPGWPVIPTCASGWARPDGPDSNVGPRQKRPPSDTRLSTGSSWPSPWMRTLRRPDAAGPADRGRRGAREPGGETARPTGSHRPPPDRRNRRGVRRTPVAAGHPNVGLRCPVRTAPQPLRTPPRPGSSPSRGCPRRRASQRRPATSHAATSGSAARPPDAGAAGRDRGPRTPGWLLAAGVRTGTVRGDQHLR